MKMKRMKVVRNKKEYVSMNERDDTGRVRMQRAEVAKVDEFKHLESIVFKLTSSAKER